MFYWIEYANSGTFSDKSDEFSFEKALKKYESAPVHII
jgi:hypothetical protein